MNLPIPDAYTASNLRDVETYPEWIHEGKGAKSFMERLPLSSFLFRFALSGGPGLRGALGNKVVQHLEVIRRTEIQSLTNVQIAVAHSADCPTRRIQQEAPLTEIRQKNNPTTPDTDNCQRGGFHRTGEKTWPSGVREYQWEMNEMLAAFADFRVPDWIPIDYEGQPSYFHSEF